MLIIVITVIINDRWYKISKISIMDIEKKLLKPI